MMWLAVILLVAGLLFVMFHKPSLNVVGARWQRPRVDPPVDAKLAVGFVLPAPAAGAADVEDAVTLRLAREAAPDPSEILADGATWSAEDAVTAPMLRPTGGPVVDGVAGQSAPPAA
jgi:hypothetical protein